MIIHEVMFGYVAAWRAQDIGDHEVWAESPQMLSDKMRQGSFHGERSISVMPPDLDVLIEIATASDSSTAPPLPALLHCYIGPTYRLVVRETFHRARSA